MAQGARKFILTIDRTWNLTAGELTKALATTAGGIDTGRLRLEGGLVRGSDRRVIGNYHWEAAEPPEETQTPE
jgi:hypothetical protein